MLPHCIAFLCHAHKTWISEKELLSQGSKKGFCALHAGLLVEAVDIGEADAFQL